MKKRFAVIWLSILVLLTGCLGKEDAADGTAKAEEKKEVTLLNVSYDPTREFYEEFNEAFSEYWQDEKGQKVSIQQSHGGSGKQGRSVIDGIEADVVTLALAGDIDEIAKHRELLPPDWQGKLEDNSTPYTSTIVFLVKKGNPKNIADWDDLVKEDVSVITPNPKTSGGARWNYLAAWIYAQEKFNDDENKTKQFVGDLYRNVEVLDTGARGATTTFVERKIGDVLLAWENEAFLSLDEFGEDTFEIITPSISILAEPPVAVVEKIVKKKGTEEVSEEYLKYLYTDIGQELAAKHYYRPRNEAILKKYSGQFPEMKLETIEYFDGWAKAQQEHFADGGTFDEIYTDSP
ncbi:sulfate ABC transporter substrate-binding protein [Sporosarcina cascadiensis]|uniref:sulfate ABC transporter substrate-binding protein n=1 Tax=Sporosarcina cascadiensis TaxID=2660747 RepID=UPI00129B0652|nr:sulfate ABC transporter substrate-binding protein [Sporosarcina cascadiensis]